LNSVRRYENILYPNIILEYLRLYRKINFLS
jgi:hypothetical protein